MYVKLILQYPSTYNNNNSKEKGGGMKNRIQELRKENRIRQEDLADAVGVTRQTIISLENGKYNASLQLAYKIAKYFDKQIEEIFLFEEE